jgi:RNA polymerase sigma-70 factor (ECF subfamily)
MRPEEPKSGNPLVDLDDASLATKVAEGSSAALEVLYDRYSRIVLSFATRMLGDRQSGEELLQEVFLRAWQQAHNYSASRGSFATWLLSITHNMSIDEIRKRRRRPQRAESADPVLMLTNVTDQSRSVEESVELGALRETMAQAIRTLPDAQRRAIELAYYRGLTQREIAEELDEPLGTIKTRMRLGMRKLRDYLETYEVELA